MEPINTSFPSTTELFLRIWFQNTEFIIQWLTLAILLVLVFWSLSSYLRDREFQAKRKKEFLNKWRWETSPPLHSLDSKPNNHSLKSRISEGKKREDSGAFELEKGHEMVKALGRMKDELRLKNKQIKILQEKLNVDPHTPEDLQQASRIQDLENRLAEYKIIEKDLANLSIYKKEVQKLKARLAEKESRA